MSYTLEFSLRSVAPVETQTPVPPEHSDLHGLDVMLVDDQEEARALLAAVLTEAGARLEVLTNGTAVVDALRRPREQWPDVLVCDMSLGDIDGDEVIARVRAREAAAQVPLGKRLPAIALSGHDAPEYRLRALLAGFQIHLGKPVDPRELVATVATMAHPRVRLPAAPAPH